MDDMVNTVAKAIYEKRNGPGALAWAHVVKSHKAPYLSDARAAIEAMMDLDGKMWVAGRDEFVKQADRFNAADRHEMASAIADRAPEHIAKAMLSKALSPSLKEQERT